MDAATPYRCYHQWVVAQIHGRRVEPAAGFGPNNEVFQEHPAPAWPTRTRLKSLPCELFAFRKTGGVEVATTRHAIRMSHLGLRGRQKCQGGDTKTAPSWTPS